MNWWWALIILGILIVWILVVDYFAKNETSEGVGTKLINTIKYLCCGGRK